MRQFEIDDFCKEENFKEVNGLLEGPPMTKEQVITFGRLHQGSCSYFQVMPKGKKFQVYMIFAEGV